MRPIVPTLHIISQSVEDLSTPHPAHDPGPRAGTPWDTTHLFMSTVVRVKGTPLSSSTMKSRWQKGQCPTLSPSALACRHRKRAQLPLLPWHGLTSSSPGGYRVKIIGHMPQLSLASCAAVHAGACAAMPGRVPAPGPCLLPEPQCHTLEKPHSTGGAGPSTL